MNLTSPHYYEVLWCTHESGDFCLFYYHVISGKNYVYILFCAVAKANFTTKRLKNIEMNCINHNHLGIILAFQIHSFKYGQDMNSFHVIQMICMNPNSAFQQLHLTTVAPLGLQYCYKLLIRKFVCYVLVKIISCY